MNITGAIAKTIKKACVLARTHRHAEILEAGTGPLVRGPATCEAACLIISKGIPFRGAPASFPPFTPTYGQLMGYVIGVGIGSY